MTRWRLIWIALVAPLSAQPGPDKFFEEKIRPVLATSCYGCHSSKLKQPMGGLMLDTRRGMRDGGVSGPAVTPGKPAQSVLMRAIGYADLRLKMPPAGKLPDAVIRDFERWIEGGAIDPRPDTAEPPGATHLDLEKGRSWWAFR